MSGNPFRGLEESEVSERNVPGPATTSTSSNKPGIDRFRMVLARLHSLGRAERAPPAPGEPRIIHHISLRDFVTLIELFGSPVGDMYIEEPGFWTVDGVCYKTPLWVDLLAP